MATTVPDHGAGDVDRLAQQLARHAGPVGLDHHRHHRGRRRRPGGSRDCGHGVDIGLGPVLVRRPRLRRRRVVHGVERAPLPEQPTAPRPPGRRRHPTARRGAGPRPGPARRPPPSGSRRRPRGRAPESAAVRRRMRVASTAARPVGGHLARLGQPLGGGQHRRELDDDVAPAVVELAARPHAPVVDGEGQLLDPPAKGRSSSSATSGPTWPVSASIELRPTSTRSKGPSRRRAAARAAPWPGCRTRRRRGR